jgi:hypothetical protein
MEFQATKTLSVRVYGRDLLGGFKFRIEACMTVAKRTDEGEQ